MSAEISVQGALTGTLLPYLAADTASALSASFLVSPLITIVDRSIMQNASGAKKMGDSVRDGFKELALRPLTFVRRPEFMMIWGLYAATYTAANYINTICEHKGKDSRWPRFLGTTVVNMAACIAKDRAFTRMFGTTAPKGLPNGTYLLFTVRDAATVAASFNLPEPVSKEMQASFAMSAPTADFTAQMLCPAGVQFLSTPLHLVGLDLYNRPKAAVGERLAFVRREYAKSVAARIGRIGPAFGIGGVGNTAFRKRFRAMVDARS